jgi:hypothetical protein
MRQRTAGGELTAHAAAMHTTTSWAIRALFLICAGAAGLAAAAEDAGPAASLRARYVALQGQLDHNVFRRPLHVDSSEGPGAVKGDIYAVIGSPFEQAGAVLVAPRDWCQILMLNISTKDCRVSKNGPGTVLNLWLGAKHDQSLADASRIDFAYGVRVATSQYLQVKLSADEGPMGTRDHRIELEAVPLPNGRTFIHLGYSYGYGTIGRLAMQAYLATVGRNRVGFTVLANQGGDQPRYIAGLRGVVERNTMRYYLAIEAFIGALSLAPQARFEKRIRDWFMATEGYSRQLHELELEEYLEMKRKENARPAADPA